jgi:hypothetical protein
VRETVFDCIEVNSEIEKPLFKDQGVFSNKSASIARVDYPTGCEKSAQEMTIVRLSHRRPSARMMSTRGYLVRAPHKMAHSPVMTVVAPAATTAAR